MKRLIRSATIILPIVLLIVAACSGDDSGDGDDGGGGVAFGLHSVLVTPAERVSEIVFAPDGRIFFAEQFTGNIRVIDADGTLQEEPFATIEVADYINLDWGLTGLALDPDFESNGYVYAFYTVPDSLEEQPAGPTGHPAIVRFTDDGGVGADETIITDDFPETPPAHPGFNANGKIHFGPDGFLYASVGDYDSHGDDPELIRDLGTPVGKLLRIDPSDGSAPDDNPFADDPDADPRVFAYGFREPFDFAFHPETEAIYSTDNTTVSCEELNIIEPGGNYGWPAGSFPYNDCDVGDQGQVIYHFARDGMAPSDFISFVEISALDFTTAARYPSLGDALVVCESWRSPDPDGNVQTGVLRRVVLTGPDFDQVESADAITRQCRGTLSVAPDGTIYYATDTEIRMLEVGEGDDSAPNGDDGNGDGDGDGNGGDDADPTQPVPPPPASP